MRFLVFVCLMFNCSGCLDKVDPTGLAVSSSGVPSDGVDVAVTIRPTCATSVQRDGGTMSVRVDAHQCPHGAFIRETVVDDATGAGVHVGTSPCDGSTWRFDVFEPASLPHSGTLITELLNARSQQVALCVVEGEATW